MGIIALEGIEVFAHHGVFKKERQEGSPFVVDVYIRDDLEGREINDQLNQTINYQEVYELVMAVMAEPVNLIETLVTDIGQKIMAAYPQIASVRVRVAKLRPFLMTHCQQTWVEMSFGDQGD